MTPYQRRFLRLLVVAAMLVAVFIMTGISIRQYFTVSESRLPNLVGMTLEEAARVLRQSHLEPVAYAEEVPGVAPDTVTSQAPAAGDIVKHGRTISLGVNTPMAAVRVPRLIGMTQTAALARAEEIHLVVPSISYRYSPEAAGTVIGQDPEGEGSLAQDQRLTLVVSQGPAPQQVALPDVQGLDVSAAVEQLRRLGFRRIETAPSAVSFDRPQAVTGMRPAAGTTVPTSTPVALFYSLSALNVVQVPSLAGMPLWRAQLALQAARLRIGRVVYVQEPDKPAGVLTASPWAYTVPGTPIDLTVNGTASADPLPDFPDLEAPPLGLPGFDVPGDRSPTGDLPPFPPAGGDVPDGQTLEVGPGGRTVPFVFNPTQMGVRRLLESTYELKLVVADDRGERTLIDRPVGPGEIVSTSVGVYGDSALLQTYIDGVFFQAWRP